MKHRGGFESLDVLGVLESWFDRLWASPDVEFLLAFAMGLDLTPKRTAQLALASKGKSGGAVFWDTGEIEIEVYDTTSWERPLVVSTTVETAQELESLLEQMLEEVKGVPGQTAL